MTKVEVGKVGNTVGKNLTAVCKSMETIAIKVEVAKLETKFVKI